MDGGKLGLDDFVPQFTLSLSFMVRFSQPLLNVGSMISHPTVILETRTVLSWTALSARILAYINFLCQWYSPDTGFSSLPLAQAVAEFIFELLPATATSIFAIVMFAKAPKGSWKTMVIGAIAILVLDTFGDRVIFRAIDYIGLFPRRASPLAGPDRRAFQTGRIVGVWTAMSVAARLGVSFVSSLKKQPETNEGLDTASLF